MIQFLLTQIAKLKGALSGINSKIANMATAKVTGTMANEVNTYASASYPSGFTADNCAIIGVLVKTSSDSWYSNNPNITCMGDTSLGIRIKTSDSGFVGQPYVVLLMKIPS